MTGIPGLRGIDHVALTVPDLDAATEFYCTVVGGTELYGLGPFDARELATQEDGRDWTAAHIGVPDARFSFRAVRVGSVVVELFAFERPGSSLDRPPGGSDLGGGHIGFAVDDIEAATQYLRDHGVRVLDGPIEVPAEAPSGAMRNRYFADPWGNQLELTERPS